MLIHKMETITNNDFFIYVKFNGWELESYNIVLSVLLRLMIDSWRGKIFFAQGSSRERIRTSEICYFETSFSVLNYIVDQPEATNNNPGGFLAEGHIDALGNIVYPLHRYKYDLKNGRNVSGEGYFLKNWPEEIRIDGVFIGSDNNGGIFG